MWREIMVFGVLGGLVLGGTAAGRVHTIERGETLGAIARRYGVDLPTLTAVNGLRDPDLIAAGSSLVLPEPGAQPFPPFPPPPHGGADAAASHRVRSGETLDQIARRYGVSANALAAGNDVATPDFVLAGAVLRIPSKAALASTGRPPRIVVPASRALLRSTLMRSSKVAGVPSDLVMALAWQESGWQSSKVSSTRAVGVMQLMPDTVEFVSTQLLGVRPLDPRDPTANIRMGTRFLRYLLDSNRGNIDLALASYYQGLRSVKTYGPLDETRQFVANVKALRGRL